MYEMILITHKNLLNLYDNTETSKETLSSLILCFKTFVEKVPYNKIGMEYFNSILRISYKHLDTIGIYFNIRY